MAFYSTLYNRNEAESRLQNFTDNLVYKYAMYRNFDYGREEKNIVSGLSPAINRRIICEWEVVKCVLNTYSFDKVEKFVQEICWRTYWKGYLEHYPDIWANYLNDLKNMKDIKESQTYIDAISGQTGIKCFDHWIKDLVQDGYLHNHTRMWFASIWVHTLRLPWQLGANIFLENLIDGDPASNTLSWRWVTGIHTKGKSYLAYPENIKKYTNGKFYPVNQLATRAKSVDEGVQFLPKRLNFESKIKSEKNCLLIHESDLSFTIPNECDIIFIQNSPLNNLKRSSVVQSFISNALKEIQDKCNKDQKCDVVLVDLEDTKMIKRHLNQRGLNSLYTNYPALGAVNDQIEKLKSENIIVEYKYQKWDRSFWPHSSKGFFKLKSKIPKIIKQLNCV